MATINLLYATKVNLGGWATFTAHLHKMLEDAGHRVELLKIGNSTESFHRPFGEHGVSYRNVSADDLPGVFKGRMNIVAALGKHYVEVVEPLLKRKHTGIVVHDTAESTNRMSGVRRPWCIRKELAKLFDGGVFIRHPYMARPAGRKPMAKRKGYVATSRVDFDKNTAMILDANRLGAGIDIVGFENRLYTKFKIMPNYPEWVQSPGTHPRSGLASFDRLLAARGMVDLTDIKGDGGGTQYTFLEAWDAGAIPVIGRWWLRPGDDMQDGVNCFTVADAKELAALCKRWPAKAEAMQGTGVKRLAKHSPKIVAPQVIEWLESL